MGISIFQITYFFTSPLSVLIQDNILKILPVIITVTGLSAIFILFHLKYKTRNLVLQKKIVWEKDLELSKIKSHMNDLEVRHRTITDSLNYASRIQQAMLPSEKYFKKYFDKSFILHMPKDILSGDFYWIEKRDDKIFVAAGDCTGHGVPGALMSMMGHDMLEKAINVDRMVHPSHILDAMNEWIGKTFNCEKNNNSEIHDGIDLGLCVVDLKRQYVEFAGALSRLYIIRNNSIHEIKGDRFSLGSLPPWASYRNASFDLLPDDTIYLFSDGYPDQFGGSENKKFKYRRFRCLLNTINNFDLDDQKMILKENIVTWKGINPQVDDILVVGFKPLN